MTETIETVQATFVPRNIAHHLMNFQRQVPRDDLGGWFSTSIWVFDTRLPGHKLDWPDYGRFHSASGDRESIIPIL